MSFSEVTAHPVADNASGKDAAIPLCFKKARLSILFSNCLFLVVDLNRHSVIDTMNEVERLFKYLLIYD